MSAALITGAGTGIGRALALSLLAKGYKVYGVGRRVEPLEEVHRAAPSGTHFVCISADVATEEGRKKIVEAVSNAQLSILIHNAGVIGSLKPMLELSLHEFRHTMAINTEAPLFLTQALVPNLVRGSRVLNISSGAAHRAIPTWGTYCVSKAALLQVYEMLKAENADSGTSFGSVRPGIVDTDMQTAIRQTPHANQESFTKLFQERKLVTSDTVAHFLTWLLTEVGAEEYSSEEWDIRDAKHHARWMQEADSVPV
eukprot:GILK01002137.1.p1 GENE.GILK01002137.1~~GILK01002137.1.p1  ORF type:complete len:255 (+),score=34.46 GILK01002137.1:58-822(+)